MTRPADENSLHSINPYAWMSAAQASTETGYPANVPHSEADVIAAMEQGAEALRRCILHDHSQSEWAQPAFDKLIDVSRAIGIGV